MLLSMRTMTAYSILLLFGLGVAFSQTVDVSYLTPQLGTTSSYKFLRLGNSSTYFGGLMHNISSASFGDGNDFSIFTYSNRDITFNTGTGNFIVFPVNGGNAGIGTVNPTAKLHVNGSIKGRDFITVDKGGAYRIALNGQTDGYITGRNDSSENKFYISSNGSSWFTGGNVGIGTTSPGAVLEVNKSINEVWTTRIRNGGGNSLGLLIQNGYGDSQSSNSATILQLEDANNNLRMKVQSNGKVGIGTADIPNGYKLAVAGKIIAEEIDVQLESQWPDYVFYKNYQLPTLKEVENHILEKGYLKDIPSAKEVEENGIKLGEMNAKLLQKIEELMLYTIQQQKELNLLKSQLKEVKRELD